MTSSDAAWFENNLFFLGVVISTVVFTKGAGLEVPKRLLPFFFGVGLTLGMMVAWERMEEIVPVVLLRLDCGSLRQKSKSNLSWVILESMVSP